MNMSCKGMRVTQTLMLWCMPFYLLAEGVFASVEHVTDAKLACYYYDRTNPLKGMGINQPGLPFVWARGEANETIQLSGTLVDGFFMVDSLVGERRRHHRILKTQYESRLSLARKFCENGLKKDFPNEHHNMIFIHQGAKRTRISARPNPVVYEQGDSTHFHAIDKLVVFGDSLSDQGNLKNWLRLFPKAPYFAGRFSNGEIWVDYLQHLTGIAVQNFAYSGSVANPYPRANLDDKNFSQRMFARLQIRTSGTVQREIKRFLRNSLAQKPLQKPESTLFALWMGANDYLQMVETRGYADIFLDQPTHPVLGYHAIADRITDDIAKYVEQLHQAGARNFIVGNLPDLGRAPRMLKNTGYHHKELGDSKKDERLHTLSSKVSMLIEHHNHLLKQKMDALRGKHPDITLILVDAATAESSIVKSISIEDHISPFNYDISHSSISLLHEGKSVAINKPCYVGGAIRSRTINICQEPQKTVAWDDLHPTTYGHCLIASYLHKTVAREGLLKSVGMVDYLRMCRPDLVQ